ncbi:MAG TPA: SDR family oxidoreductase [Pseudonocardia sp.]|nr:SDR family oxidoreductase [Pseudonocardia sp.]
MPRLEGKVAVITGAGSGLGRQATQLFAAEGARVVVMYILLDRAEGTVKLVAEQGGTAVAVEADTTAVNGMVRALSLDLGKYGIRVNAVAPTHGMSPNFLMEPGAPVVGQSYEQVQGPWDPAVSPIPLKLSRPPNLLDNANAALFLVSDESAYISGITLPSTDGGTLARVAMQFPEDG